LAELKQAEGNSLKHNPPNPYRYFDEMFFWLQLACMDFTFVFGEIINNELDSNSRKSKSKED
jgi:hypothetical protein